MSLEEMLNCRMARQPPFVLIFYSWSVKYVPWNPLHVSHNLKGRLWSCIYLETYVILCIRRHWAQFCNYFQHLSVYSQALLDIILLLSSLVFHVFNFEAFCRESTISKSFVPTGCSCYRNTCTPKFSAAGEMNADTSMHTLH